MLFYYILWGQACIPSQVLLDMLLASDSCSAVMTNINKQGFSILMLNGTTLLRALGALVLDFEVASRFPVNGNNLEPLLPGSTLPP